LCPGGIVASGCSSGPDGRGFGETFGRADFDPSLHACRKVQRIGRFLGWEDLQTGGDWRYTRSEDDDGSLAEGRGALQQFLTENPQIKVRPYYNYGYGGTSFIVSEIQPSKETTS